MREEEDSFVSVTRDRKLRQRFTLGVPKTFDQDYRPLAYIMATDLNILLCAS